MDRLPYVRRRAHLGAAYRLAVVVLYPIMRFGFRWDWVGREKLFEAQGGIIVAANHISYVDPMVVSYLLWECDRPPRFLAKEGIMRIPVIGAIVRNAGQIPVYRESTEAVHAIRDALTALDKGECVVVYPEGTVTRDPDLWPMKGKTGAVRLALASGRPLYPVAQWGPQEVMRPYVKEFRLLPRKLMRISVGDPVDLTDLVGRPLTTETLTIGTNRLMDAITALESEIRGEPAPARRFVFRSGKVQGSIPVVDASLDSAAQPTTGADEEPVA
ncbi:MAG: lysophospholipid acyltransferase family protein [Actinomycetes bacterium]